MENIITPINFLSDGFGFDFGKVINPANPVRNQKRDFSINKEEASVVVLSFKDFKQPELITELQLQAKEAGMENITDQEIEAEIADYRKKTNISKGL